MRDIEKVNNKTLITSVVIDEFDENVKIANARRATAYIQNKCRIPKKYQNDNYDFNAKGQLIDIHSGKVVVKNSRTAGKPRYRKVNGNDIYNGNINTHARANLVRNIHNYFIPYLKDIKLPDDINIYPLTLELIFKMHDKGKFNIDNDNKWIWRKCIQDTLTELKIISDDNNDIINRNEEETLFIPEDQAQQLIINLYGRSND